MQKILIVDDEVDIRNILKEYFEMKDYIVLLAKDGDEALLRLEDTPDIILLDISMPGINGYDFCKKVRDFVTCPIIFLSARIEEVDKISGFQAGGDDYIQKPFSIVELGARVEAHLRRELRKQNKSSVKFNDQVVINYAERMFYFQNTPIHFAKKEYEIIELLSKHPNMIFDKERIYESLWGFDNDGENTVVAEHIRRIRSKLKGIGCKDYIETVWGVGYKWMG